MQGIKIPVSVEVLQSSVSDLQKVLSSLKVDSSGFKQIQSIINAIKKDMDTLQIQSSKPFLNQKDIQASERLVSKIQDRFTEAGLVMSRIKFSDLKLDRCVNTKL